MAMNSMRCRAAFAALALVATSLSATARSNDTAAADAQHPLTGLYEGEARTATWPTFLLLRLEESGGTIGGSLRVMRQDLEIERVETDASLLTVHIGTGPGEIILAGTLDDGVYKGELRQGEARLPFRLHKFPLYSEPGDRLEAWQQDLETLATRFITADRSFSAAEKGAFLEAVDGIRSQLPRLNDAQIIARMAAAIALSGNAHTRLYLLRNRTELPRLPIRLWWFSDGLYVVTAARGHEQLVGCRVDEIGGTIARHARDATAPLFAGNSSWKDYKTVYSLTSPDLLHGVGITPTTESAEISLSGCSGEGRPTLTALPLLKSDEPVEAWWDLSPLGTRNIGWTHALNDTKPLPLYLTKPLTSYWFEFLPESGLLYVQYNRSENMAGESVADFSKRVLESFEVLPVKAIALDFRFNTGGDSRLITPLMKELQARTAGMPRYLITSRATFSAGIHPIAMWREAGNVTLVGEPVGDDLDFWAEGGNIILPNSGLYAHFANTPHRYSPAPCPEGLFCFDLNAPDVSPDIAVYMSWSEYRKGHDPSLQAILTDLRAVTASAVQ
jgi:hypothetical protein